MLALPLPMVPVHAPAALTSVSRAIASASSSRTTAAETCLDPITFVQSARRMLQTFEKNAPMRCDLRREVIECRNRSVVVDVAILDML